MHLFIAKGNMPCISALHVSNIFSVSTSVRKENVMIYISKIVTSIINHRPVAEFNDMRNNIIPLHLKF